MTEIYELDIDPKRKLAYLTYYEQFFEAYPYNWYEFRPWIQINDLCNLFRTGEDKLILLLDILEKVNEANKGIIKNSLG